MYGSENERHTSKYVKASLIFQTSSGHGGLGWRVSSGRLLESRAQIQPGAMIQVGDSFSVGLFNWALFITGLHVLEL